MHSYIAKVVFKIVCGDGNHTSQFDEQLRLIYAATETDAFDKALLIGRNEQETFLNHNNEKVEWRFIGVAELYDLKGMTDGVEICSRIHETHQSEIYTDLVRHKEDSIRSRITKTKQPV